MTDTKRFSTLNLRYKILLSFGTLFTLIFITFEMFNIYGIPFTNIHGMFQQRQREFLNALSLEADIKKSYIIRFVTELKDDVSSVARNESIITSIKEIERFIVEKNIKNPSELLPALKDNSHFNSLITELNEEGQYHGFYDSIQVVNPTGLIIASTHIKDVGTDISHESYFGEILKDLHLTHFFAAEKPNSKTLVLKYIRGVLIDNKIYLLIVNMKMDDCLNPILNADIDSTNTNDAELAGPDFTYISRAGNISFQAAQRLKSKIVDMVFAGHEGSTINKDFRGRQVFAAYRHLIIEPDLIWGLVIKKEADDIYLPIRKYIESRILFLVLSLVFILSIIFLITRRLSRPLEAIRDVAIAVGEGNYDVKFPDASGGEISTLLETFKSMISKVREKTNDLLVMNTELEKRVDEEIKHRMLKEQLLVQQSKQASMGEVVGMIAHQWKQPLNAISLTIQDLKDAGNFGELNKESVDEATKAILSQIMFMSKTIDDFRTFLMPSRTKVTFNVRKAIEDIVGMFGTLYKKKHNVEITIEAASPELDLTTTGYPNEFKQVILNLINNSRDAIESRVLATGLGKDFNGDIRITLSRTDNNLYVKISDKGGGIPKDIMEKIYEPYVTSKADDKGTGLGLYMSRTIIEQNMGGRLSVRNIDGGAEFTITLNVTW
ncbi:sensor histidine kinase [Candidatus Magnetomonas plexicatena]|uniref:sensor histidine kinase n=1 Tax=Candidatus Magnetomonas plexicatena TaxID=2552947 RepID=UPI001C7744A9|nr:HAMP domain-containing histidine kinase [Nitrospirales bacterium LBB_01]